MKFKKLIIQGFKSFVDKTVIEFPDGITAVVGPNGSGKSNILDAIRWILGEQNPKELRGSNMDDIIFAGSENRKGSNIAFVTLVLTDIDESLAAKWGSFSEVEITRKYCRDGDREYFINNKRCKLKDIREIFYDTGLGSKSISIIEQGKVEKLISATPEEIRQFFDEAAGIIKFKEKKKEAERRLEQSMDNLNRVNDILNEVKYKREQLQEQLANLNLYRELSNEKNRLEKIIYSKNYFTNIKQYNELIDKHNNLQLDLSTKINEFEILRKEEEKYKNDFAKLEIELKGLNSSILDVTEKLGKLNTESSLLENNILNAEQSKDNILLEIDSIEKRLKDLTKNRDIHIKNQEVLDGDIEVKNSLLLDYEEALKELNREKDYLVDEIDENRDNFLKIAEKSSNLRNQIIKSDGEIFRLNREIDRLRDEKLKLSEEILEIDKKIEEKSKILSDLILEKDILSGEISKLSTTISDLNAKMKLINEEISNLKGIKMSHEAMLAKLETDLNDESFGKELRSIFKNEEMGLLLDYELPEDRKYFYGDVIVFKLEDKENVFSLLGKTKTYTRFVFEEDISLILENISKGSFEKVSEQIVKIDGIYYKSGDSGRSEKLIKLRKEIEDTRETLNDISKQLLNKLSEYGNLEILKSENDSAFERLKLNLNNCEKKVSVITSEINNYKNMKDNFLRRDTTLLREINFNTEELERLKIKNENENELLSSLSEQQKELEEHYEILSLKMEEYEERITEEKDKISNLKIELSGLREKSNAYRKELIYIEREINSASTKIIHLRDKLNKLLTVDLTNWRSSLEVNRSKIEGLEKERIELLSNKNRVEGFISEISEQIKKTSEIIEESNKINKKIELSIQDLKLKIVQFKTSLDNMEEAFRDRFGAELKDVYEQFCCENFNLSSLKNSIIEIESKISSIGALNMGVEADYKEVEERYSFLSKQKNDLDEAIQSIRDIIYEIDKKTAESFYDTFQSIKKNFKDIFKILFGGEGRSDITLTDEGDILNTGVEIFVQPPGKRLQNMTLLSGGEKAMTAAVLLFAMFLHKPSPFCFLDEIDAPLDDANIGRFCSMLKDMSKKAQFVIITHNQKTMEVADQLYGVTMQEPGVSKVISVKFEN